MAIGVKKGVTSENRHLDYTNGSLDIPVEVIISNITKQTGEKMTGMNMCVEIRNDVACTMGPDGKIGLNGRQEYPSLTQRGGNDCRKWDTEGYSKEFCDKLFEKDGNGNFMHVTEQMIDGKPVYLAKLPLRKISSAQHLGPKGYLNNTKYTMSLYNKQLTVDEKGMTCYMKDEKNRIMYDTSTVVAEPSQIPFNLEKHLEVTAKIADAHAKGLTYRDVVPVVPANNQPQTVQPQAVQPQVAAPAPSLNQASDRIMGDGTNGRITSQTPQVEEPAAAAPEFEEIAVNEEIPF